MSSIQPPKTSSITRPSPSCVTYHIPTTPPTSQSHAPLKTTIHLPTHSTWSSGLHFHTTHTEYLHLIKGSIFLRLGSTIRIISAPEARDKGGPVILTVPKYARHDWGRAEWYLQQHPDFARTLDGSKDLEGLDLQEEVIVEEWTDPVDMEKALFFWNLNGVIQPLTIATTTAASPRPSMRQSIAKWLIGSYWVDFQLFVIFWHLDNFPVLFEVVSLEKWTGMGVIWLLVERLEYAMEYVVTYGVLFVASLVGRVVGVKAVEERRTPRALWDAWSKEGKKRQ